MPVTFALFSAFRPHRAAFLSLFVAALVLPVGFGWELPGVTSLDKSTIPLISAWAACVFTASGQLRYLRLSGLTLLFIAVIAIGCMATAITNGDPYFVYGLGLQGLSLYDGVGLLRALSFSMLLPYLLGRMLVREVAQVEDLLRPFVAGFLIYSLPMLWEIRMSPQLHTTVYGYFPHSFIQQMRAGGFRPVVFFGHGLPLAITMSFAILGSVILWRRGRTIRGLPSAAVTAYLSGVLVLCKTFSAMIYAYGGGALIYFTSAKTQMRVALAIACFTLAYPVMRSFDVFPTQALTSFFGSASEDRSESLAFRFENEDILLDHAMERPMFGWGGYGRNRVFSDDQRDVSVTDGLWIILIGQLGVVGFVGVFGLMLLPIFQAPRAMANLRSASDRRVLASLALIVALSWVDSLPNSMSGGQLMLFVTGAFSGVVATYQRPRPLRREPKKEPVPVSATGEPLR